MDEGGDEEKNLSSDSIWDHEGHQRGEPWLGRKEPVKKGRRGVSRRQGMRSLAESQAGETC